MKLKVAHEVVRGKHGKIKFRKFRKGGYDHYYIRLYLKGDNLADVSHVEYELHPTFSNRIRTVNSPAEDFSLYIWTWGEFDVAVSVYMKDGEKIQLNHSLEYSNMLPANENEYVDESPESYRGE
ncbi:hypothetical protein MNBD_GAMMA11-1455 [hydrothermal vent metagenome]|uniref:YEATS domain-containing protein n=1 Tax=hydrothermal vent metagenome TaxID=652676 RepID=A0A3B0XP89_9ZZZZ